MKAIYLYRVKAIYYGCANDKFGGCGSVGNLEANMAELGQILTYYFNNKLLKFLNKNN